MARRLVVCFASLFFASLFALSQSPNMDRWVNAGSEQERTRRLVALGVEEVQARLASGEAIEWHSIKSASDHGLAILVIPCGSFDASYLYLLESGNAGWQVTDWIGFTCHHDEGLSVETAPVRYPNIDDVLVHRESEDRGLPYVEQHFNVFTVDSGSAKFEIVLDTKELVSAWHEQYKLRLTSGFSLLSPQESTARVIEETQCVNENGHISIQRRRFTWNESAYLLVPTPFVTVRSPSRKMEASCR